MAQIEALQLREYALSLFFDVFRLKTVVLYKSIGAGGFFTFSHFSTPVQSLKLQST